MKQTGDQKRKNDYPEEYLPVFAMKPSGRNFQLRITDKKYFLAENMSRTRR